MDQSKPREIEQIERQSESAKDDRKFTGNADFWQKDPRYQRFDNMLMNTNMTFEDVFHFTGFDKSLDFNYPKSKIEKKWNTIVNQWNADNDIDLINETVSFAAITLLMIVLPYNKIVNIEFFSEFDMEHINVVYAYNTGKNLLQFAGAKDMTTQGPLFPPAFREWFDNQYNKSSWWLTYRVYERLNGFQPIIPSTPTKKIK